MFIKVGDTCYSNMDKPIKIMMSKREYERFRSSFIGESVSKETPNTILITIPNNYFKTTNEFNKWNDETANESLCNCNFCVCSNVDKARVKVFLEKEHG